MRRAWSTLIVSLLAAVGLLAGTPAPAQAAKKPSPIKVAPSVPIRGAKFSVTGTMPTKLIRPVQLERKAGTKWIKMTTGKTSKAGRYKLTTTITKATKLTLRVVAKKVKIKGKWYPKVTTKAKTIKTKGQPATITTTNLPLTTVGLRYATTLSATGGTAPYAWSATGLPTGLKINLTTGTITGTPTKAGNVTVKISVRTKTGTTASKNLRIDVGDASRRISANWSDHTCAITTAGAVKCWGNNSDGQLGDGTARTTRANPMQVSGLSSGAVAVVVAFRHSCVLLNTGAVQCWGHGGQGRLGDGLTQDHYTPNQVGGLTSGVTSIALTNTSSCALLNNGSVKCWGGNHSGEIGDGTSTERPSPVAVSGLSTGVTALSSGADHSCAIRTNGTLTCWGGNYYGQLGDGTTAERHIPVPVRGWTNRAVSISSGVIYTCAVTDKGRARCWGYNHFGQLGDGGTEVRNTPTPVIGLPNNATSISAGLYQTCALSSEGTINCWGYNYFGQLGDGTTTDHRIPNPVPSLSGVAAVSAGYHHTCALTKANWVWCWGQGTPPMTPDQPRPVNVLSVA